MFVEVYVGIENLLVTILIRCVWLMGFEYFWGNVNDWEIKVINWKVIKW